MRFENTNLQIFYDTAKKLGIPVRVLQKDPPKIILKFGSNSHVIARKSMGLNSQAGIELVRSKPKTQAILKKHGLPVLNYVIINSIKEYQNKAKNIGFPQVIKPAAGQKGKGVYLKVNSADEAKRALNQIFPEFDSAVVEPYFQAQDYRFLVLDGKVIGLSRRLPPQIACDGKHNLRQLIEIENKKRLQDNQKTGRRLLNRMHRWSRIDWYLSSQRKSFQDVPKKGEIITVYPLPNFSTGGSVETINPQSIHPSLINLAECAARVLELTICGVDILIKNLKKPASPQNSVIIELNSDPGIRLHEWPNQGSPQPVASKILQFIQLRSSKITP